MPVSISGDGSIGGLELGAFEDVSGTPTDNQALTWDEATGQWVPETVTPTSLDASVIDSGTFDAARIPDVANAGIGSNLVSTTTTSSTTTSSSSYTTPLGLSVTITPTSASSKVLVMAWVPCNNQRNNQTFNTRLSGGNIPSNSFWQGRILGYNAGDYTWGFTAFTSIAYLDSPATTSPTTYSFQVRGNSTTVYVNRTEGYTNHRATLVAIEVAG